MQHFKEITLLYLDQIQYSLTFLFVETQGISPQSHIDNCVALYKAQPFTINLN